MFDFFFVRSISQVVLCPSCCITAESTSISGCFSFSDGDGRPWLRRVCEGSSLQCLLIFTANAKWFTQVLQHQVRVDTVLLAGEPRPAARSRPQRCPFPRRSRFTLTQSLRERVRRQLPRGSRPLCVTHSPNTQFCRW